MIERVYRINKPPEVQEKLSLSSAPLRLRVINEGNRTSCRVETIPPTPETESGLSVSNELLQELLKSDVIEPEETYDENEITLSESSEK